MGAGLPDLRFAALGACRSPVDAQGEKIVREHCVRHPAPPDKGEDLERAEARPPGKPPGRYLGSGYWLIAKNRNNRTKMLTISPSATGNAADFQHRRRSRDVRLARGGERWIKSYEDPGRRGHFGALWALRGSGTRCPRSLTGDGRREDNRPRELATNASRAISRAGRTLRQKSPAARPAARDHRRRRRS